MRHGTEIWQNVSRIEFPNTEALGKGSPQHESCEKLEDMSLESKGVEFMHSKDPQRGADSKMGSVEIDSGRPDLIAADPVSNSKMILMVRTG